MMKSLEEVLNYRNTRVIERFCEDLYFDREEAEEVFRETLKWLWLAATSNEDSEVAIYHPMQVMDKMWHCFLIFSKEYSDFCNEFFGKYIHHEPHTRKEAVDRVLALGEDGFRENVEQVGKFQSLVYDELGKETVIRWFVNYPHKYSPDELLRRARPLFSERGVFTSIKMHAMEKGDLLAELAKSNHISAWCGGPGCGPMCADQ